MIFVQWDKLALQDRESIFRHLNQEAGANVAIRVDYKFEMMAEILRDNPEVGLRVGRAKKLCKLVIPRFPFIMIYMFATPQVKILRVLHTARRISGKFKA